MCVVCCCSGSAAATPGRPLRLALVLLVWVLRLVLGSALALLVLARLQVASGACQSGLRMR